MAEKEKRESPGFLRKVREFRDNPPENPYSNYSYQYLFHRLKKYVRLITSHLKDEKKAKAEVYRHLVRYMLEVQEYIDEFENDLQQLLKEGEIVYFPSEQESVEKINGKIQITVVAKNKISKWIKAYKQFYDEEKK
jgi:hypothetical protein